MSIFLRSSDFDPLVQPSSWSSTERLIFPSRSSFSRSGWEDKSFKSLAGFFPASSRHVLLSKTKVVELGKGFLKVDVANSELGFSEEIAFDVRLSLALVFSFSSPLPEAHPRPCLLGSIKIAVLALGSTYAFPMRPLGTSLVDVKQPFIDAQKALKSGQDNIVIVGGGTVGIEYAGGELLIFCLRTRRTKRSLSSCFPSTPEIIAAYPKKSVTLISGSDRLLNDDWPIKLSNKLEVELTSRKVKVVYGERVEKDLLSAGKGTVVLKDGTSIDGQSLPSSKLSEEVGRRASSRLTFLLFLPFSRPHRQRHWNDSQHQDHLLH